MASRLQDVVLRGTRLLQPLATTVASGTIYYVTDEFITERASDSTTGFGLVWESISDVGGAPGPPVISQTSFLVSGGQVAWVQDFDFTVSAATYFIQGIPYSSPQTDITLDASDPVDNRIDVIVVDNTGTVDFITGTPAPSPSEPDYDPGTQLKLAIVFIPATASEPVVNTEVLYFENAGGPGEWAWTEVGTTFNVGSLNNPKPPATKDIEGTAAIGGDYAQGDISSGTYLFDQADLLVLWIRSKAAWANNRGLAVSMRTAGVLQGNIVNINRTGSFGFDSSVLGSYQQIAIPAALFGISAGATITQIRITAFGNGHGFYIADMYFQEEGTVQPPIGITQTQADARYLQRSNNLSDLTNAATARTNLGVTAGTDTIGITIDGGGSAITTGVKGYRSIPITGNIASVRLLADVSGDAVVDLWVDTYANYPPTNADSITGGNEPELTTDIKYEDTTLTGWTVAVTAGSVMGFNVDSAATVTRLIVEVKINA